MADDTPPSAQNVQNAVNNLKSAEQQSDSALQRALKDDAATNQQLTAIAKGNDQLMAKIHQIGTRLADPHERSEKVRKRKEARLRQRIERQSLKQQQLITFWTKKFAEHIARNDIDDEDLRKNDENLQNIESKLIKLGIDTNGLFTNRQKLCAQYVVNEEEEDEEQQLLNLQNLPDPVLDDDDDDEEVGDDVDPQTQSQSESIESHQWSSVDVESVNFKPLNASYPGFNGMKPMSALKMEKVPNSINSEAQNDQKTEALKPHNVSDQTTKSMDSQRIKDAVKQKAPKSIDSIDDEEADDLLDDLDDIDGTAEIETSSNQNVDDQSSESLYPSIKGLKPKQQFTRYQPMKSLKSKSMKSQTTSQMKVDSKDSNESNDDLLDDLDDIDGTLHIIGNVNGINPKQQQIGDQQTFQGQRTQIGPHHQYQCPVPPQNVSYPTYPQQQPYQSQPQRIPYYPVNPTPNIQYSQPPVPLQPVVQQQYQSHYQQPIVPQINQNTNRPTSAVSGYPVIPPRPKSADNGYPDISAIPKIKSFTGKTSGYPVVSVQENVVSDDCDHEMESPEILQDDDINDDLSDDDEFVAV